MFLIKGEFKLITLQKEFNKAVCSSVEDIKKKPFTLTWNFQILNMLFTNNKHTLKVPLP